MRYSPSSQRIANTYLRNRHRRPWSEIGLEEAQRAPKPLHGAVGPVWHVLYAHPRAELKAALAVRELGLAVYLPVATEWQRIEAKRQRREIQRPVYPRYLFVERQGREPDWLVILGLDAVCGVLSVRGEPMRIGGEAVEEVMRLEDKGWTETPELPFQVGATVTVANGPLARLEGKVTRIGRHEVQVEVVMFGRLTAVDLPHEAVAVCGRRP